MTANRAVHPSPIIDPTHARGDIGAQVLNADGTLATHTVQDTFESNPRNAVGKQTPLQRHVAFFDRNGDGIITPKETYDGCRAIGCNVAVSAAAAVVINGTMGWPTARGWLPTMNIDVARIQRAMHGSDTRLYNENGDFDDAAFDTFFARYDKDGDGCWSVREFLERTRAQRNVFDLFGQTATVLEFGILYYLVGRDGRISHDKLLKVYDGSLFTDLEAERRAKN